MTAQVLVSAGRGQFRLQRAGNGTLGRSSKLLFLAPSKHDHRNNHDGPDYGQRQREWSCKFQRAEFRFRAAEALLVGLRTSVCRLQLVDKAGFYRLRRPQEHRHLLGRKSRLRARRGREALWVHRSVRNRSGYQRLHAARLRHAGLSNSESSSCPMRKATSIPSCTRSTLRSSSTTSISKSGCRRRNSGKRGIRWMRIKVTAPATRSLPARLAPAPRAANSASLASSIVRRARS